MALLEAPLLEEPVTRSTEAKVLREEERAGYGACSQCSCQAFMGSGDLCDNCHHNYSFHS